MKTTVKLCASLLIATLILVGCNQKVEPKIEKVTITVTGDANVTVNEPKSIEVAKDTKWSDVKPKVKVTYKEGYEAAGFKLGSESGSDLTDNYAFNTNQTVVAVSKAKGTQPAQKVTISITGDERVKNSSLEVEKGKTWQEIKAAVNEKLVLKPDYDRNYYGAYLWKLNDENGADLKDSDTFSGETTVYVVTNYTKFDIQEGVLKGCDTGHTPKVKPKGKIIIPEGVEVIDREVFDECHHITDVQFPKSLKEIKFAAFFGTPNLKVVDLSDTQVTLIGKSAFAGSLGKGLEKITFPETLETIETIAFKFAKNLEVIDLSKTKIKNIEESTFLGCEKLNEVKLPAGLETIGYSAFSGCSALKKVNIFGANITKIEKMAFEKTALEVLELPETLPTLGELVFNKASIGKVMFPASLTDANELKTKYVDTVFKDCTSIKIIDLSKTQLTNIADETFFDSTKKKFYNKVNDVIFPATLKTIGKKAFSSCGSLNTLDFLQTELETIDEEAFLEASLKTVKLPLTLKKIGINAFYYSLLEAVQFKDDSGYTGWKADDGNGNVENIDVSSATNKAEKFAKLLNDPYGVNNGYPDRTWTKN